MEPSEELAPFKGSVDPFSESAASAFGIVVASC
jgi:hypothetical protein